MATITYSPAAPVMGDTITLSLAAASSYEVGRFEIVSVPDTSDLEIGALVDSAGDDVDTFPADVSGVYAIKAYVYRHYSGGGAYAGDPAGEARDELVSTATGSVTVGRALSLPVAAAGNSLDLRLVIVGTTITDASIVNPTTETARLAALDSTVTAALAAMVGQDIGTVGEDFQADVRSLISHYVDHLKLGGWHVTQDVVNDMTVKRIDSDVGARDALNTFYDCLVAHLDNSGTTSHVYPDRSNLPIAPKASNKATATVLLADLRRRVYARHIDMVGTGTQQVHNSSNITNAPSADTLLSATIVAILDYYAAQTPTTPTGENAGVAGALEYGFTPSA